VGADETQSSGGLSSVVDFTLGIRRGDETAHRAPPVTRKDPSNLDNHRQRTHLVAAAHNDRRALLGGLLVAALNRRSTLPRRRFIQIAMAFTALSCLAPAAAGDDVSSKIGLIAIHVLAATILAPVLARQTTG
jgi:hypothetical protein